LGVAKVAEIPEQFFNFLAITLYFDQDRGGPVLQDSLASVGKTFDVTDLKRFFL